MNISNNSVSFKGYKNVLKYELSNKQKRIALLSAELTDDVMNKDLTNYHNLLKERGLPLSNIIHGFYQSSVMGDKIYLNNVLIPNDNLLKGLSETLPKKEYNSLEKSTLKAYSFLANLTKRMMNNDLNYTDNGYANVVRDFNDFLVNKLKMEQDFAGKLIMNMHYKNSPLGKVASIFNARIQNIMERFFAN